LCDAEELGDGGVVETSTSFLQLRLDVREPAPVAGFGTTDRDLLLALLVEIIGAALPPHGGFSPTISRVLRAGPSLYPVQSSLGYLCRTGDNRCVRI
jgi:hypothetical protein